MADGPNEVFTSLLDELGWSPRALARRINHFFGPGTVADTAPYHWRDSGCIRGHRFRNWQRGCSPANSAAR